MFLIVRESHEVGQCSKPCFGPVSKQKIFNAFSYGYLHVNGKTVVANSDTDGIIYKISAGINFYLYDMKAEKFICWRKPHRTKATHNRKSHRVSSSLVARRSSNVNCQFRDMVSEDAGYVYLVPAFNTNLKMRFNNNGKFVSECVPPAGISRHRHKCLKQANFLFNPYEDERYSGESACMCPEAAHHFCKARFAKMKVFESICNRSNETYES